jgi:tripartite-type tricarboxylate transporter receptor subunit TctC
VNSLIPQVRDGRLRALAILGPDRIAQLPDVPTIAEAGFPDKEVPIWLGLAAPAATPRPIIARLEALVAQVLSDPEGAAALTRQGIIPSALGSAETTALTVREHREQGELIRRLGITPS